MPTISHRVSFVTCPTDETVIIALDVTYDDHTIRWFDTVRERIMTIDRIVDPDPAHFTFARVSVEGGGTYTFVPMTLERYRTHVRSHLVLQKNFTEEEAMLAAFEQTRREAW
mgnify:CR=1 FL=1